MVYHNGIIPHYGQDPDARHPGQDGRRDGARGDGRRRVWASRPTKILTDMLKYSNVKIAELRATGSDRVDRQ